MSRVGFEHTTPVFKRAKAVHGLDRAATVIGNYILNDMNTDNNSKNTSYNNNDTSNNNNIL
jgi:hypothetical protein